jgi:hypothetical protein
MEESVTHASTRRTRALVATVAVGIFAAGVTEVAERSTPDEALEQRVIGGAAGAVGGAGSCIAEANGTTG